MKYTVHWQGYENGKEVDKQHGTYSTFEEAYQSIINWWKKNYFNPYYLRIWKVDNTTIIDYGSHSCFYHIVEEE